MKVTPPALTTMVSIWWSTGETMIMRRESKTGNSPIVEVDKTPAGLLLNGRLMRQEQ